jgi:Fe2+ transport system protein FeoA
MKVNSTYAIQSISGPEEVIKRLYNLGLLPGIEILIIRKISFQSVTVIQFGETILALNEQEIACLHGS